VDVGLCGSSVDADKVLDGYIQYIELMQCWSGYAVLEECMLDGIGIYEVLVGSSIGVDAVLAGWMQFWMNAMLGFMKCLVDVIINLGAT